MLLLWRIRRARIQRRGLVLGCVVIIFSGSMYAAAGVAVDLRPFRDSEEIA